MHSSFLVAALAASASFVSAHSAAIDKRHGSLVDIDTVVGPILEDAEIIDLYKRAAVAKVKADTSLQPKKRMNKVPRDLAGIEVSVGVDIHLQVYTLLENTLSTLDPVFCTIEETIAKADEIASEELGHTLQTAFMVIHKATGGLSAQLKRTARTATGGFLKRGSILPEDGADLQERTLADAEVAQLLSVLLSKVAGTVKLAEGLVSQLPVLGPVLNPLFIQINGDLALILSSVGNLLVGVVGLVRDLLSGVLTTVVALPILDSLLGGLLGGL